MRLLIDMHDARLKKLHFKHMRLFQMWKHHKFQIQINKINTPISDRRHAYSMIANSQIYKTSETEYRERSKQNKKKKKCL